MWSALISIARDFVGIIGTILRYYYILVTHQGFRVKTMVLYLPKTFPPEHLTVTGDEEGADHSIFGTKVVEMKPTPALRHKAASSPSVDSEDIIRVRTAATTSSMTG